VDDNRDAADSLAWILEFHGHAVRAVYDGQVGLNVARDFLPDCVFSDINMPSLDGYGLAQRLRSDPATAGVKLIAMTGYSDSEFVRKSVEAGFDYRLTKGCTPDDVMEVLTMIEEIKHLATKTQDLARMNVELAGQTKELLHEVKEEVKEVKQEVKELKKEIRELKKDGSDKKPDGERA
jgi:CheY-like chemotaxis protein